MKTSLPFLLLLAVGHAFSQLSKPPVADRVQLPNGWSLTPAGKSLPLGDLPLNIAVSHISSGAVQTTFWLFAILFTGLLIAELSIMIRQIKTGPKH